MSREYSHSPLKDSRSIRLLKPTPLPRKGAVPEYELIEASLYNVPVYSAVSYTWGGQNATTSIACAGHQLAVTPNCAAALSCLSRKWSGRLLWVDSVCIDQTKSNEQSRQVALMAEIYSKAENVLIWLGESNDDSEIAMKTLRLFAQLARLFPAVVKWKFKKMQKSQRMKIITPIESAGLPISVLIPHAWIGQLHPMDEILERSWFHRIWTLQEIVLARKAVLVCGDRSISWDSLSIIADVITEGDASSGFTEYPGDSFQRVRVVSSLRSLLGISPPKSNMSYQLPKEHPFGRMKVNLPPNHRLPTLGIANHFFPASMLECGKPQDKVYGLYAILQKHGVKLLPPDYDKPMSAIFVETARAIIEHDSSLELLYFVSCQRILPDLPSWVPDPTDPWFAWIPGFEYTCASKESGSRFQFNTGDHLSIFGFEIDTIQLKSVEVEISQSIDYANLGDTSLFLKSYHLVVCALQEWIKFAVVKGTVAEGDPVEAFCMVTLQDIALAFRADAEDWSKVRDFFATWTEAFLPPQPDIYTNVTSETKSDLNELNEGLDLAADEVIYEKIGRHPATKMIHHAISQRADGNCLFRTASDRLGIATRDCKEGDKVVLVSGLRLPMILREREDGRYQLIGACYMHGAMQGELWPMEQGNIREFVLI